VQVITSSQDFVTGSTKFGSLTSNTHQFTGSVSASGSLNINNGVLYADGTNVGVGTTSPTAKLQLVNTDADVELRLTANNTAGTEYDPIIRLTGQSNSLAEGFRLLYDNSIGDTYFDNVYNGGDDATPAIRFRTKTNGTAVNALTISHGGNVGIGTASPNFTASNRTTLDINGATSAGLGLSAGGTLYGFAYANSGVAIFGSYGNFNLELQTNSTTKLTITGDGNVGIGTTSVTQGKLVISAPDESTISAISIRQSNSMTYGFDFALDQTINGRAYIYSVNNGTKNSVLEIDRQPTYPNLQLVNSGGNVGIGGTPSYHLDVKEGTDNATLRVGSWAVMENVSVSQAMFGYNAAYQTSAGTGWRYINTGYAMAIRMHDAFGTGDIMFHLAASSGSLAPMASTWDTTAIKMIIKNDGNVGIGTTSPSYPLTVYRGGASVDTIVMDGSVGYNVGLGIYKGGSQKWAVYSSNIDTFSIYNTGLNSVLFSILSGSGNVGIGTTVPSGKLDIWGSNDYNQLWIRATTGNAAINFDVETAASSYYNWRIDAQGLVGNAICFTPSTAAGGTTFTSPVMTITQGGNIGIGTTAPSNLLDVNGSGNIRGTLNVIANEPQIYLTKTGTDAGSWRILGSTGGDTRRFRVYDETLSKDVFNIYKDSTVAFPTTASVGIGTTSPQATLDVRGKYYSVASVADNIIEAVNSDTTNGYGLYIRGGGTTSGRYVARFKNGADSDVMWVGNNGNVGIGTTSPGATLSVFGKTILGNQNSGFYVPSSTLHIASASVAQITFEDFVVTAAIAVSSSVMAFGHQESNVNYRFKYSNTYNGNYASTGTTFVQFNPTTNYISSGNLGIGTTSPSFQLDVSPGVSSATLRVGSWAIMENVTTNQAMFGRNVAYATSIGAGWRNINTAGATAIRMYDDPGDASIAFHLHGSETAGTSLTSWDSTDVKMTIRNSGCVGIGTPSPSSRLHISGSGGRIVRIEGPSNQDNYLSIFSGGIEMFMDADTTNSSGIVGTQSGHNLILRTNGDNRVWINTGGNVGISTSSPGAKLDVAGDINIDGSYFHKVGNSAIVTAPSDQGLVAYYGFDEGSGTNISDKTGRNNTTSTNLTYTTTAIKGTALNGFGADANNVVLPNSSDFDFGTGDFAVSLWCYPNSSYTNTLETLIEMGRYTAGILIRPHSNTIEIYAQGALITSPSYVLSIDVWHHIVVTRVSSTLSVFANGTRLVAVSNSSDIQVSDTGYIGRSAHASSQVFHGIIDEVKFYKGRGLSYGEVRGQYLSRGETALIAPIFSNGTNVGIGTTSLSYALDVAGTIRATGDVIAYSDARVKENVNTITDALTKVISLRGVSYTRKDTDDKSEKVGVIAQEVLEILPQVVQQDAEGNYSVAYGNIVGVLIEAIKELKAEIDILKQK
jgi:hypothetical protein